MHEHRRQEIKVDAKRRRVKLDSTRVAKRVANDLNARKIDAGRDFARDERERVRKSVIAAESLKQNKNQNVEADYREVDIRHDSAVRIVISDGKHIYLLSTKLAFRHKTYST